MRATFPSTRYRYRGRWRWIWQRHSSVRTTASTMVKRGMSRSARSKTSFIVSFSPFAAARSAPSAFAKRTKERSGAMAAKPKFDPELHEENPEWREQDFANAKPASEILPSEVIAQFK